MIQVVALALLQATALYYFVWLETGWETKFCTAYHILVAFIFKVTKKQLFSDI